MAEGDNAMLTQEQIDYFHENGYLIMPGLIKGKELEMLQRAADVVQEEGIRREGDGHRYYKNKDGSATYWRSEHLWQRDDIFQAVTVHPELLENIGQCIGDTFYPWNDSLVVKLARSGAPVKWHQDPPYWDPSRTGTFAIPNFTTDIYLDYSGPDNGCVWAIHGRHLVGPVDFNQVTEEELFERCGAVPLRMQPGDVLFHCLSTPHGSTFNYSDKQRRIFYIHYLNEEVFQDGYASASWSKDKQGWNDERHALVRNMLKTRERFGFPMPDLTNRLALGDRGFRFAGTPVTPPRHWETLQAGMTEAERAGLRAIRALETK